MKEMITKRQARKELRKKKRSQKKKRPRHEDPDLVTKDDGHALSPSDGTAKQNERKGQNQPSKKRVKFEDKSSKSQDSGKSKRKSVSAVARHGDDDDDDDDGSSDGSVGVGAGVGAGDGIYTNLPEDVAALMRQDDAEIEALEKKLGLSSSGKSKSKLHKEYAMEGFGEDFGEYLDGLENILSSSNYGDEDVAGMDGYSDSESESESDVSVSHNVLNKRREAKSRKAPSEDDDSSDFSKEDDELDRHEISSQDEALIRRDEEEIAELERKLGLGTKKEKKKLHKEFETQEGFGAGFGDFLDGLNRIAEGGTGEYGYSSNDGDSSSYAESESDMVGGESSEISKQEATTKRLDSDEDSDEDSDDSESGADDSGSSGENDGGDNDDEDDDDEEEASEQSEVPDHDVRDTYRPASGEDIYGKRLDAPPSGSDKPSKYVPPHLRAKKAAEDGDDPGRQEKILAVRRLLNAPMNKLSEDSLIPVAQSVADIYKQHPNDLVHETIWENTRRACVASPLIMSGLVPIYVSCLVGVHLQTNDTVQLGEYLLETVTVELFDALKIARTKDKDDNSSADQLAKSAANLLLILCYLYNFNIAHCSLMYDIIRALIESFEEVDMECLHLLLAHSGRSLRADDPLALKDIVLLVQKRSASSGATSTRAEYLVSAIMDLKNNKRRKEDGSVIDRVTRLRKILGRIRSSSASKSVSKSDSVIRISLQDIQDAEWKGRWWKVGASWVGNQHRASEAQTDSKVDDTEEVDAPGSEKSPTDEKNKKLLRLASKYRMNTDRKRSIFCIIMGGTDFEDVFEKLCRGGMLQNRSERDTIRVLLECCIREKSYNKFYSHLAAQILDYQPQSKFSLQLAFWDTFKNFESMEVRKSANLAKLLYHLVTVHNSLRAIPVLKAIDISDDETSEAAMVFLTVFFTCLLEHFDDPKHVKKLLKVSSDVLSEEEEGFRASLLVFFLETLRASPKNKKDSRFRVNYKSAVKALGSDGFGNML